MISSHMPFDRPYTLSGCTGHVSGMGMVSGVPYTVADDEYTRLRHLYFSMLCGDRSKESLVLSDIWEGSVPRAYLHKVDRR
jgi:hypothetical protein